MKLPESIVLEQDFSDYVQLRDRAILLERLQALKLPTKKDELFRQSSIEKVYEAKSDFCVATREYTPLPDHALIVFKDGILDAGKTRLLSHMSLARVKPLDALHVNDPLSLMAHTYTRTTWRLNIHDSTDEPIMIVHRSFGGEHHSALDIVIEKGVNAQIVERYEHAAGVINHATDIVIKAGASLHLSRSQIDAPVHTFPITTCHVAVEEEAKLTVTGVERGAEIGVSKWDIHLVDEHARVDFNLLHLAKGKQQISSLLTIYHEAPNTTSHQLIKQIVSDEAKGVVDGKVHVSSEGVGTVAHQLCRSLLLSQEAKAKVHVKPQLEIHIDALEASHGASVGQLDEAGLFYLMSRGFSELAAKELLLDAFIKEITQKIPEPHKALLAVSEVNRDTSH